VRIETDARTTGTGAGRVEPAPTSATGAPGRREEHRRTVSVLWSVGTAAFVVLAVVALLLWSGAGDVATPEPEVLDSGPPVGSQEYLARLADQGYIPQETVDRDRLLLERLVNAGRIPAETLD
jgi:hypothetical protein